MHLQVQFSTFLNYCKILKTTLNEKYKNFLLNSAAFRLSLISFLLLFASCKVQFIPNYSAELSNEINETAKKVDNFYLTMQDVPLADRQYDHFSTGYIDIEVDLNSLVTKNRVRPLNTRIYPHH